MIPILLSLVVGVPPDSAFEPFHQEDGVVVTIARKPDPLPWVRGTGPLPGKLSAAANLLKAVGRYAALFEEFIETSHVIAQHGNLTRVHLVWPFPIFFQDRDAVVSYEFEESQKEFKLRWKRTEEKGDPSDGRRIERVEGVTVLTPGSPLQMRYTYYGDLGGDFSKSTREGAYQKEPLKYFDALRKALTQK